MGIIWNILSYAALYVVLDLYTNLTFAQELGVFAVVGVVEGVAIAIWRSKRRVY